MYATQLQRGDLLVRETRNLDSHDTDRPSDVLVFRFDWFTFNKYPFAFNHESNSLSGCIIGHPTSIGATF